MLLFVTDIIICSQNFEKTETNFPDFFLISDSLYDSDLRDNDGETEV